MPKKTKCVLLILFLLLMWISTSPASASSRNPQVLKSELVIYRHFTNTAPAISPYSLFSYSHLISNESVYQGVDPYLIASIAVVESSLRWTATSHCGAVGLMQVMPTVWTKQLQVMGLRVDNLYNPETNIKAGVLIFKHYLKRTKGNTFKALCMYNAGNNWWKGKAYARKVLKISEEMHNGF